MVAHLGDNFNYDQLGSNNDQCYIKKCVVMKRVL